jgi:cation:H+ antiporter
MLMSIAAVVAGLAVLVWSADHFVEGAAAIAHRLGVSNLIIGITVIGFGTSAPEMLVSIMAALENIPDIAIGNALGSNVANIGLILGVTALLVPVPVSAGLMRAEYPLLAVATLALVACLYDLQLTWLEGVFLLGLLLGTMVLMIRMHRRSGEAVDLDEIDESMSALAAWVWVIVGLLLLVGSSRMLVWGASNIAQELGVSELVIGLTIVAVGTSLPELAASLASLKKSVPDLAVGNVIGSNLFNSLAVVGIAPMLGGFKVNAHVLSRDLPVMLAMTAALFLMSWLPRAETVLLTRVKGLVLLLAFVGYQAYLYYVAASGAAKIFG